MIETPRLLLEPLSPAHADALFAIYSEPAVRRFLITCPMSRGDFDRIFQRTLEFGRTHGMWAVMQKPVHTPIGRVGFLAFGEGDRPELAFLFSEPFWGRGLATEASYLAAIRVVTKLGMSAEQPVALEGAPAVVYRVARPK